MTNRFKFENAFCLSLFFHGANSIGEVGLESRGHVMQSTIDGGRKSWLKVWRSVRQSALQPLSSGDPVERADELKICVLEFEPENQLKAI